MSTEVLRYTESLVNALEDHYRLHTVKSHQKNADEPYHQEQLKKIREGSYDFRMRFYIVEGRKYLRIEEESSVNHDGSITQKHIHAFVNKKTGEVFKPASWKAPAKHVRYNLMDSVSRQNCYRNATWHGSYLYLK